MNSLIMQWFTHVASNWLFETQMAVEKGWRMKIKRKDDKRVWCLSATSLPLYEEQIIKLTGDINTPLWVNTDLRPAVDHWLTHSYPLCPKTEPWSES